MSAAQELQNAAIGMANGYASQLSGFTNQLANFAAVTTSRPTTDGGAAYAFWGSPAASVPTEFTAATVDGLKDLASASMAPNAMLAAGAMPTISFTPVAPPAFNLNAPEFTPITAPEFHQGEAPDVGNDSFQGVMPVLTPVDRPQRPVMTAPAAPVFSAITLPQIDEVIIPSFTGAAPFDELSMPSTPITFVEEEYQSDMLDEWAAQISSDLKNGGYGIREEDETPLYDRERDRQLQLTHTAMEEATRMTATRGFSMPPGSLMAHLAAARQEGLEKISAASRDLTIKRADMYIENRRFTFGQVEKLEERALKLHMAVLDRALSVSKTVAEFAVVMFNAKVARFNALSEGFKTSIAAYQAQVQGELSKAESQKLKLQAVNVAVDVQKNQAMLYGAQLDSMKTIAEVYRTDIAAAQGLLDMERTKLEVFKTSVEAFSEGLKADALKLQRYDAQLRGDVAKVDLYKAQVEAQTVKVDFAKAQLAIVETNARISSDNARTQLAHIQAQADVYRSQTQGAAASNEAAARAFVARTDAFRAMAAAQESAGRLGVASYEATSRVAVENVRSAIDQQKGVWDTRMKAASAGADVLSRAMQASLNQVIGIATASA